MAQKRKLGPKGKPAAWVRTSGATGDDSMERMEKWNHDGCGVDEDDVKFVRSMPNEGVMRPMKKEKLR